MKTGRVITLLMLLPSSWILNSCSSILSFVFDDGPPAESQSVQDAPQSAPENDPGSQQDLADIEQNLATVMNALGTGGDGSAGIMTH